MYNINNQMRYKMQDIKVDQDIKSLSEVRNSMTKCIKQVHNTKRPLIITQHGKGVAVLLSASEYEAMKDKLAIFTDVQTALNQISQNQGISNPDAKKLLSEKVTK